MKRLFPWEEEKQRETAPRRGGKIKSLRQAREIVEACFCPKCGSLRILVTDGAVCPNHRFKCGTTQRQMDVADTAKRMLSLPKAHACDGYKVRCRFMIDGLNGDYAPSQNGTVEALDELGDCRIRKFRLLKSKPRIP